MGIDLAKLKKAQAEAQFRMNRGGGPSMKYWKPQDGENRIRILPPWTNTGPFAGAFWREVWQHWKVTDEAGPIMCPAHTEGSENKNCPVCEFVEKLRAQKSSVEAQEMARDLRAKVAYFMSIIDLKDPIYTAKDLAEYKKERPDGDAAFDVGEPKVQLYAATQTIYEQIASIVLGSELDITDLAIGHNIIINKIGNKDKLRTRYTVQPDLKKTAAPVPSNFEFPDLSKVGAFKEYGEMVKLLASGPAGSFGAALPAVATSAEAMSSTSSWNADASDLAEEMRRSLKS